MRFTGSGKRTLAAPVGLTVPVHGLFALALAAVMLNALLAYTNLRRLEDVDEAASAERSERVTRAIGLQALAGLFSVVMLAVTYIRVHRERKARADVDDLLEHYHVTLANVGDGVIAIDTEGTITFANDVASRAIGWADAEVIGHPIGQVLRLVHPQTRLPADSPALRAVRERRPVTLSSATLMVTREGREVPIDDSAAPVLTRDGRVVGAVLVFRDASDRVRNEQQLEASRLFLRSVLDALPTHVAVLDRDGRILEVNAAWRRFADQNGFRDPTHGVGASYLEACEAAGPDAAGVAQGIRDVIDGKRRHFQAEYPCHAPQQSRWFQMHVTPMEGMGPVRAVVAHEDVSGRVLSQQRIERQSDQLRRLADTANLVNAAQDVRSVLGLVTAGALEIIGAEHAATHVSLGTGDGLVLDVEAPARQRDRAGVRVGAPAWRNAPCGELPTTTRRTREQLEADPDWRRFLALLGRSVPSGWMGAPLIGRDGRHLGVLHLFNRSDAAFTDQDESILTQLARLAASAIENAWLYEELREGDRRKDEFLATLAHELRNPLAPMSNVVEIIKRSTDPDARADATSVLERQLRQMVRLIDDLLDISRITKGKLDLRPDHVDLATVIRHAVETTRPSIDAAGHHLVVSLPLEPVYLQADQARLSQVVANLLHNAAKYSEPAGTIEISLEATPREATVRVRDSGLGIAPDLLPRVFDLFAQGDHTVERARGGLGIGLTLVRSIVELHGGRVDAASEGLGAGSTFTVRLPLASGARRTSERPIPAGLVAAPPAEPRPQRILVVDDNVDAADSLATLLRLEGHDVRVARDGPSTLDEAPGFAPTVALLDIGLPGLSGYDVARALRSDPRTSRCRLIALTGWGQDSDRNRSRDAGFDHHLVKPLDFELLKRVLAGSLAVRGSGAM